MAFPVLEDSAELEYHNVHRNINVEVEYDEGEVGESESFEWEVKCARWWPWKRCQMRL